MSDVLYWDFYLLSYICALVFGLHTAQDHKSLNGQALQIFLR